MKKEYDFNQGVRGKFHRENKVQKTLRLDADVLAYFQGVASERKVPYQTLINQTLREAMHGPVGGFDMKALKQEVRKAVQEALARR